MAGLRFLRFGATICAAEALLALTGRAGLASASSAGLSISPPSQSVALDSTPGDGVIDTNAANMLGPLLSKRCS